MPHLLHGDVSAVGAAVVAELYNSAVGRTPALAANTDALSPVITATDSSVGDPRARMQLK